jgi:hypothetical protein
MAGRELRSPLGRHHRSGWRALAVVAALAGVAWRAPAKPDPELILNEAEADTAAGRYESALAKHVWFYENALKYKAGLAGVRLSFALNSWRALGQVYPPALAKLRALRDSAARAAMKGDRRRDSFHDFAAINRTLNDDAQTSQLFIDLDRKHDALAEQVFDIAEPALIKAKEYALCGKYLDPDRSFRRTLAFYKLQLRVAGSRRESRDEVRKVAEAIFATETASLVALLVINGRQDEADRIAVKARKECADEGFWRQIERARKGELPPFP